jgi:hypothetical protein
MDEILKFFLNDYFPHILLVRTKFSLSYDGEQNSNESLLILVT